MPILIKKGSHHGHYPIPKIKGKNGHKIWMTHHSCKTDTPELHIPIKYIENTQEKRAKIGSGHKRANIHAQLR